MRLEEYEKSASFKLFLFLNKKIFVLNYGLGWYRTNNAFLIFIRRTH